MHVIGCCEYAIVGATNGRPYIPRIDQVPNRVAYPMLLDVAPAEGTPLPVGASPQTVIYRYFDSRILLLNFILGSGKSQLNSKANIMVTHK